MHDLRGLAATIGADDLAARADDITVVNIYAINGKEVGDPAYGVKLAWFDA